MERGFADTTRNTENERKDSTFHSKQTLPPLLDFPFGSSCLCIPLFFLQKRKEELAVRTRIRSEVPDKTHSHPVPREPAFIEVRADIRQTIISENAQSFRVKRVPNRNAQIDPILLPALVPAQ